MKVYFTQIMLSFFVAVNGTEFRYTLKETTLIWDWSIW